MRPVPPEEFSLVLDALVCTVLESRYGFRVWPNLPADETRLSSEVWAVLNDESLWFDLARRVSVIGVPLAVVRRHSYLRRVTESFVERARNGFRLPMPRIDPCTWDRYSTDRWLGSRSVLAILTGPERTPIVETVRAVQEARVGIDPAGWRVIGVASSDWMAAAGSAEKGVVIGEKCLPVLVEFERPLRVDAALIVNLPRQLELDMHRRLTHEAWSAGVFVLNPASRAAEAADRKHMAHYCWAQAGIRTPASFLLPAGWTDYRLRQVLAELRQKWNGARRQAAPGSTAGVPVYILPDCSTEGDRVKRFVLGQTGLEHLRAYAAEHIHPAEDALVRRECGNVRIMVEGVPRRAVLRLNVSKAFGAGCSCSAFWVVARDPADDVASPGHGACFQTHLVSRRSLTARLGDRWIGVPAWAWSEGDLLALGKQALEALNKGLPPREHLSFVGLDLLPSWSPQGSPIRWTVLEANARPSGLGVAEPLESA